MLREVGGGWESDPGPRGGSSKVVACGCPGPAARKVGVSRARRVSAAAQAGAGGRGRSHAVGRGPGGGRRASLGRSPPLPTSLAARLAFRGPSLASPLSHPLLPLSGHRGGAGYTGAPPRQGESTSPRCEVRGQGVLLASYDGLWKGVLSPVSPGLRGCGCAPLLGLSEKILGVRSVPPWGAGHHPAVVHGCSQPRPETTCRSQSWGSRARKDSSSPASLVGAPR